MSKADRPSSLVLIRHAESERNKQKKGTVYFADDDERASLRGIPDYKIPITSLGVKQAQITGIGIREEFGVPDYLYHSGYKRTIQTTQGILEAYPKAEQNRINVRQNAFIRERDPGYAYDMTKGEAEAAFPWLAEHWETYGGFFARPPGGESLSDVVTRIHMFINTLFRDRSGKKIFVVTHGGTLRCFRFILERWDYEQALRWPPGESPKNCGLTVYEYGEQEKRLVLKGHNTVYS